MSSPKNLLRSTAIFSGMTAISRVTGMLREIVLAYYFGATGAMDAFNVAYRIPNFLRNLFAEGAFSQAFIPILAEYRQTHAAEATRLFLERIAGLILFTLTLLTLGAILTAPWWIYLFAPGFIQDPPAAQLTTTMLRITFPYILFISLSAYVSGILNSYGKFGIPAFAPNLLNLAIIGTAIWLAPHLAQPITALAWGILIGGIAQLACQIPALIRLNLVRRPRWQWHDPGVQRVLKLMVPALFGVSVAQISFLVDNILASWLPSGSISWLNYSNRLTLFPLGVFGVAIATVILPQLASRHALFRQSKIATKLSDTDPQQSASSPHKLNEQPDNHPENLDSKGAKSFQEFSATLDWALRLVLTGALPATLGISMLANPIVITIFYATHGQFSLHDVTMVTRSLHGFAVGIPAFMLVKILASSFYSQQNIRTPVRIAAIALGANALLAIILVQPLQHAGLALATALSSCLNASLLFYGLYRSGNYQPNAGWKSFLFRLFIANGSLGLFLKLATPSWNYWIDWSRPERVLYLGIICAIATVLYLVILKILGIFTAIKSCH